MKRSEFITEVENLTFGIWLLEFEDHRPAIMHVKDAVDNIVAVISETTVAKFDCNFENIPREERSKLIGIITEYAQTDLEDR